MRAVNVFLAGWRDRGRVCEAARVMTAMTEGKLKIYRLSRCNLDSHPDLVTQGGSRCYICSNTSTVVILFWLKIWISYYMCNVLILKYC